MTLLQDRVLNKLKELPPEKQEEVLHFVEFLAQREARPTGRKNVQGLWADLDLDITEVDIEAARREMWGSFPRELPE